ncbi:beta strand repeat-containing protein [Nostoc sp.]
MTRKYGLNRCLQFGLTVFLGCLGISLFIPKTLAQQSNIVPDNTLGAESSQVIGNFQGQPIEVITGGAIRQINLFQSFREFNVSAGRGAYFFTPNADIQNILARVTGNNPSEILGKLGTFQITNGNFTGSNANLFLINPNRIVFGKDASLDVQGSFVGTTANGVQFGNQGVFSATNPQAVPLLIINPSALFFNQINQSGIINRSRKIAMPGSFYLIGGDIIFDGGFALSLGNRLELGAVAGTGTVELIGNGNQMQLAIPESVPKADIVLQNNAFAATSKGGAISVNAANLSLSGNSSISSLFLTGEGQTGVAAGDVVVNATGNVTLDNSNIGNQGSENSLGDTGNVAINAQSIRLTNQSQISSSSPRSRGNIILNAKDNVSLDRNSLIITFGKFNPIGKSGDITITTRNINLSNQSTINSGNTGQGQGGKITLKAQEAISLTSGSDISSGSTASGFGQVNNQPSGDIEIKTRTLTLDGDNTFINSSNLDEGKSGDIQIIADDSILLNGFASISSSTTGQGDSGNIELKTRSLTLNNGGNILTSTSGRGNSGDLLINASDSVTLSSIGTFSNPQTGEITTTESDLLTSAFGAGNAGNITVNAQRIFLNNGVVSTSNSGQGNAGNILVQAQDSFFANNNSLILSNIGTPQRQPANGNVGNIAISARTVSLTDGAQLQAGFYSGGQGNAGLISVKAKETISFAGTNSGIFANVESGAVGNGSDIQISAPSVSFTNGAGVIANNAGQGNGGKINITAGSFFLNNGVVSTSNAGQGNAGNILVQAQDSFFANNNSLIASNIGTPQGQPAKGNVGNIDILARTVSLTDGAQLQAGFYSGGQGNAGLVSVKAQESISFTGKNSGIFTDVYSGAVGNGSDIQISAPSVSFTNGALVIANNAGEGNGGKINITAGSFFLNNAVVSTSNAGQGNAGIMTINADRINLDNQASLNANTRSPNKDPNREQATINLNTQNLSLRHGSSITTNATGENVFGGNINIYTTKSLIALENSHISANSDNSRGGRVVVNAQGVFVGTQPSDIFNYITATSGVGLSGTVDVNSPDNSSIQNSFTELSPVIDTNTLIANSCISRGTKREENSFTITGSGALTTNRPGVLVSTYTTGEVRGVETTSRPWKKGDPIIEPQGLYRLNNGQLLLSRECSN